jgi:hypothetical protein
MADHRQVPEPGEMIYAPRPSWAPVFLAIGVLGLVCGTFASGFIFEPRIWFILGAIISIAAFRSIVRGAVRDYYRLPRRQETCGAALPVETISGPSPRS